MPIGLGYHFCGRTYSFVCPIGLRATEVAKASILAIFSATAKQMKVLSEVPSRLAMLTVSW
jgi:hypothetical protein